MALMAFGVGLALIDGHDAAAFVHDYLFSLGWPEDKIPPHILLSAFGCPLGAEPWQANEQVEKIVQLAELLPEAWEWWSSEFSELSLATRRHLVEAEILFDLAQRKLIHADPSVMEYSKALEAQTIASLGRLLRLAGSNDIPKDVRKLLARVRNRATQDIIRTAPKSRGLEKEYTQFALEKLPDIWEPVQRTRNEAAHGDPEAPPISQGEARQIRKRVLAAVRRLVRFAEKLDALTKAATNGKPPA